MAKRVIIVHGWGGYPEEGWFPWMKKILEAKGFEVIVPKMPDTDAPKIEAWVNHLAKIIGTPDKDTFLVVHSIGGQTTMRYLQNATGKIGGIVFVGGWLTLNPFEDPEEKAIVKPWLETPIDFEKVKKAVDGKIIGIFSDDDPYVPLENVKAFEQKLGAKTIILKGKGHMGGDDNCNELPEALNAVVEIAQ